ncbi:MAG: hypothetical protein AAB906_01495 [Patescibacteria group bacterium]
MAVNLPQNDDVKNLLEKNLELTQEIHGMMKSVKRYMLWQRIMGIIYFLLIVVPIVLSILYLPPLMKNLFGQYQQILNGESGTILEGFLNGSQGSFDFKSLLNSNGAQKVDVNNLPPEIQKLIKDNVK